MAILDSHPLFIQEVQTLKGYNHHTGPMGNWLQDSWNTVKQSAQKEIDKVKTQVSQQFEAEKQKAIQQGLTQIKTGATQFVEQQAQKFLTDPAKVAEVKAAVVPKIAEQVSAAVQPVVQYAVDNPKKTALYVGLGVLGVVALFVLATRGAAVSVVKSNPRRRRSRR